MARRWAEADQGKFPWDEIFTGLILDVGAGDDPLVVPHEDVVAFDLPDGGGDDLTTFFPSKEKWDVIHGSHVWEHFLNPIVGVNSWLECLKPNGKIVSCVPDLRLYEGLQFPSKYNAGHRSTWSMDIATFHSPIHCKLPEWLRQFPVKILRCELMTTNYNFSLAPGTVDQTYNFDLGVECCIEMVLEKE